MTERSRSSIIIVGGGASGVILAGHLCGLQTEALRVTILKSARLRPWHRLLDVPARSPTQRKRDGHERACGRPGALLALVQEQRAGEGGRGSGLRAAQRLGLYLRILAEMAERERTDCGSFRKKASRSRPLPPVWTFGWRTVPALSGMSRCSRPGMTRSLHRTDFAIRIGSKTYADRSGFPRAHSGHRA